MKVPPMFSHFLHQLRNYKGEPVRVKVLPSFGQYMESLRKQTEPPKGK